MKDKIPYIILFSNWYSGATLLTLFLNSHSQITSNGEAFPFSSDDHKKYLCSCGHIQEECEFYNFSAAHMKLPGGAGWDHQIFTQVPAFSHNKYVNYLMMSPKFELKSRNYLRHKIPAFRKINDKFQDAHYQFVKNSLNYNKASIYLDGTKSIPRANLMAGDKRYAMKAIHLVRDGRGFCYSYMRNQRLGFNEKSALLSANKWLEYINQVDSFSRKFPEIPLLTVRYKEMCNSSPEFFKKIFNFIETPEENVTEAKMDNIHILGNKTRRNYTGTLVEDLEWKESLTQNIKDLITEKMKSKLIQLGYIK